MMVLQHRRQLRRTRAGPPRKIVILGCSGHAKVVIDIVEKEARYEMVGWLDSEKPPGARIWRYEVCGACERLPSLMADRGVEGGIVAVGDNWARGQLVGFVAKLAPAFEFVSAVHPSAEIGADVAMGEGTVVMAGAAVNPGCRIGRFCVLNTGASLDHDSVMEDFSSLAPAAATGGDVRIGAFSAIGIGAIVLQGIRIGAQTVIGAGATVLKDVPDGVVAYGTPARIIRPREPGDPYLSLPRR